MSDAELVERAAARVPIEQGAREALTWLEDRRDNCLRIAKQKEGADLMGWLEDATYFEMAARALRAAYPTH